MIKTSKFTLYDFISFALFFLSFFFVFYNSFLSLLLVIVSVIYNKNLILLYSLMLPTVETSAIVLPGVTISKVFYILFIVYTFFLLSKNSKKRKKLLNRFLILIIISLALNSIVSLFYHETFIDEIFVEIWIKNFPKIILFYFFTNYFIYEGKVFFEKSLNYLMFIPFVIPLIYYDFISNFQVYSWYNLSDRKFLDYSDPNEYTNLLVLLVPIIIFRLLQSKSKIFKLISLISLILILSISFQTASKSGFIAFLIAFSFSVYFFARKKIISIFYVGIVASVSFILISYFLPDFLNFSSVLNRFTQSVSSGKNDLTSGRTELWLSGIDGFINHPILGNGGNIKTSIDFNYLNIGDANVVHNTFIQLLFHFGLIMFLVFNFFLYKITPSRSDINNPFSYSKVLLVCLFTLFVPLFSLSWLWKEIFWIFCSLLIINKILYNENSSNYTFLG